MNKAVNILLISCALPLQVFSCSCVGWDTFLNSVGNLMVEAEVLSVERLDTGRYAYTATVMKVHRVMKGEYDHDTIYILNDKGFECFHGVDKKEVGTRYIITGQMPEPFTFLESKITVHEGQLFELDLCLENFVYVEGNKVRGNISKNRSKKVNVFHKLYARINKRSYGNWRAGRQKPPKKYKLMQTMSVKKFERKLRRKGLG